MPKREHNGSAPTPDELEACRALIAENLSFIEERCYKAYGLASSRYGGDDVPASNRADSLMVAVMEHLAADDFRVIREYKGRASIKGYLNVVIANKVVDIYRSREGRSRASEEARKYGEAGIRLYALVFTDGLPVEEAHAIIVREKLFSGDVETLRDMADRIGARRTHAHREVSLDAPAPGPEDDGGGGQGGYYMRVLSDESGRINAADGTPGPEGEYLDKEKEHIKAEALAEAVRSLDPEERLMVKLRYVDGKDVREVARAIGSTEKNTYRKLSNMLEKCRKALSRKGVKAEDLL
ncbi:MAG: sigma-70 family RNA polymerase sigma factor [Nitrospirae bacterium]|nr:sigma-70 family RNA polymerase sigma factor [Nitrospirota bacterium]